MGTFNDPLPKQLNLNEPIASFRDELVADNSAVLLKASKDAGGYWGEIASDYFIDQVHVNCAMCDIGNGKNMERSDVNGDVKGGLIICCNHLIARRCWWY